MSWALQLCDGLFQVCGCILLGLEQLLLGLEQALLGLERIRRVQIGSLQAKNEPSGMGPVTYLQWAL